MLFLSFFIIPQSPIWCCSVPARCSINTADNVNRVLSTYKWEIAHTYCHSFFFKHCLDSVCVCVHVLMCERQKDETLRGEDGLRMEIIKIYRDKEKHSDLQWDRPEHRNPRGSFQAQIYIFMYFKMMQPTFWSKILWFQVFPPPYPSSQNLAVGKQT